jgi:hypothetical protein
VIRHGYLPYRWTVPARPDRNPKSSDREQEIATYVVASEPEPSKVPLLKVDRVGGSVTITWRGSTASPRLPRGPPVVILDEATTD